MVGVLCAVLVPRAVSKGSSKVRPFLETSSAKLLVSNALHQGHSAKLRQVVPGYQSLHLPAHLSKLITLLHDFNPAEFPTQHLASTSS